EHPAGEDLLDRAVEDVADHARVDVRTELAGLLTARDDSLEPRKRLLDLVDAPLQVRAPRHLAHEHADEIGVAPPRAQEDLRDPGKPLARALVRLLDGAHRLEHVPAR